MFPLSRLDPLARILQEVVQTTRSDYAALMDAGGEAVVSIGEPSVDLGVLAGMAGAIDALAVRDPETARHGCAVLASENRSLVFCRLEPDHHLVFLYEEELSIGELLNTVATALEGALAQEFSPEPRR